jgi:hypothetical protein
MPKTPRLLLVPLLLTAAVAAVGAASHTHGDAARAAVGVTASPLTVSPHGVLPQCGACWGGG